MSENAAITLLLLLLLVVLVLFCIAWRVGLVHQVFGNHRPKSWLFCEKCNLTGGLFGVCWCGQYIHFRDYRGYEDRALDRDGIPKRGWEVDNQQCFKHRYVDSEVLNDLEEKCRV